MLLSIGCVHGVDSMGSREDDVWAWTKEGVFWRKEVIAVFHGKGGGFSMKFDGLGE